MHAGGLLVAIKNPPGLACWLGTSTSKGVEAGGVMEDRAQGIWHGMGGSGGLGLTPHLHHLLAQPQNSGVGGYSK